jgi:hypothetical protein
MPNDKSKKSSKSVSLLAIRWFPLCLFSRGRSFDH